MRTHLPRTLVLCEGREDRVVMEALARNSDIGNEGLEFQDYGGESKLRAFLQILKVTPEYKRGEYARVLVTRDADTLYDSAWDSVADSIKSVFGTRPSAPAEWTRSADGVEIGCWVVPGVGKSGMIETLCLDAARDQAPGVFECLDPFIECLGNLHEGPVHEKVRFAIWTIAAQGAQGRNRLSLERAIRSLPIPWDASVFDDLRELLRECAARP